MKKFVSILAAGALLATLLAGCGSNSGSSSAAVDSSAPESSSASEPASESTASGTGLKFGLGLVTELSGTDATADKDGKGEAAVTAAGVLLDAEGKVLSCCIDVMDASMPFTAEGAMNIAEGTEFASKQALGADYGMVGASGIGKEWNEQADAFAAWAVGKTAEEIAAGVGEDGKATDADWLPAAPWALLPLWRPWTRLLPTPRTAPLPRPTPSVWPWWPIPPAARTLPTARTAPRRLT